MLFMGCLQIQEAIVRGVNYVNWRDVVCRTCTQLFAYSGFNVYVDTFVMNTAIL